MIERLTRPNYSFVRILYRCGSGLAVFVLLFVLFNDNLFETAKPSWFDSYFTDAESVVLGRLAASRHEGFASHGAMLGHYSEINDPVAPEIPVQVKAYLNGAPPSEWMPYPPQIGLHGMFWSLVDRLFPARTENFAIMRTMASIFTASVLTGIIMWIGAEIGIAAMLGVVIGLFNSPWLIVGGRNIYLVFGTYFLPLLVSCWAFRTFRPDGRKQKFLIWLALYASFCLRFGCGYEYLTTVSMAAWVPMVFYACRDRWNVRSFVTMSASMAAVSLVAFLSMAAVHLLLLTTTQDGGIAGAFKTILSHAEVRLGTPLLDSGQFIDPTLIENRESLTVGLLPVLGIYLRGFVDGPLISAQIIDWPMTFGDVLLVYMAASLFVIVKAWRTEILLPRTRKQLALVAATGAALSATFSWHVIAKQHSYIHHHLNFMLWYIPFMLLFFALLGEIAGSFLLLEQKPEFKSSSVPDVADVPIVDKPKPVRVKTTVRKKRTASKRTRTKRPVSRPL